MVTAGIAAVVLSQSSAHQHLRPGEAVASSEAITTGRHHRSEVRSASNVVELALENLKGGRSGTIEVELHEDWAPIGVDRFRALVKDGYFSTNGKSQGDKFFPRHPRVHRSVWPQRKPGCDREVAKQSEGRRSQAIEQERNAHFRDCRARDQNNSAILQLGRQRIPRWPGLFSYRQSGQRAASSRRDSGPSGRRRPRPEPGRK